MPINQKTRPFTKSDIESLNPNQVGVYAIWNTIEYIYVGRGPIRERMLAHVTGDNPCILNSGPTAWTAEVTGSSVDREKQLILELRPKCNQKVG